MEFMPLGVVAGADEERPSLLSRPVSERSAQPRTGLTDRVGGIEIEIELLTGARVRVDAFVNEQALSRVLRALKGLP
jgi:transposase